MSAEDFAKELGINKEGTTEKGYYVINLADSNEYSHVYNMVDKSTLLDLDVSNIKLDDSVNQVTYVGDDYEVILNADFDKDIYTVTIK